MWKFSFTYRWNPLEKLGTLAKTVYIFNKNKKIHKRKRVFDKNWRNCFSLHFFFFFFLSNLYIICINHMTLVIIIFIAKYMKICLFYQIFFLKTLFLDSNGQFRVLYQWKLYNFLLKKNSSTPKTPNLLYWASKSVKKRLENNCWTKTGNLDQCALAEILEFRKGLIILVARYDQNMYNRSMFFKVL